ALYKILELDPDKELKKLEELDAVLDTQVTAQNHKSMEKHEVVTIDALSYASRYLRLYITPVVLEDGNEKALGSVILLEDVTEAVVLNRSKDEFFSIASHELRTPLTAIRGNASLIQDIYFDKIKEQDLKNRINTIYQSSMRLIGLVNDFLDVSRLE